MKRGASFILSQKPFRAQRRLHPPPAPAATLLSFGRPGLPHCIFSPDESSLLTRFYFVPVRRELFHHPSASMKAENGSVGNARRLPDSFPGAGAPARPPGLFFFILSLALGGHPHSRHGAFVRPTIPTFLCWTSIRQPLFARGRRCSRRNGTIAGHGGRGLWEPVFYSTDHIRIHIEASDKEAEKKSEGRTGAPPGSTGRWMERGRKVRPFEDFIFVSWETTNESINRGPTLPTPPAASITGFVSEMLKKKAYSRDDSLRLPE